MDDLVRRYMDVSETLAASLDLHQRRLLLELDAIMHDRLILAAQPAGIWLWDYMDGVTHAATLAVGDAGGVALN
ncbi:MAG: hypothetical protein ACRD2C_22845 [Acidimicrobiales bacterium]